MSVYTDVCVVFASTRAFVIRVNRLDFATLHAHIRGRTRTGKMRPGVGGGGARLWSLLHIVLCASAAVNSHMGMKGRAAQHH